MNLWTDKNNFLSVYSTEKMLNSFALQAFSDNSNLDWIIRFVHHKCRSDIQNIVEMGETKAHIYYL